MPKRPFDIRGFFAGLFISHHDPATPTEAQTGITTNVEVTRRNTVRLVKRPRLYDFVDLPGVMRWIKNIFLDEQPEILNYFEGASSQFYTYLDRNSRTDFTPGGEPEYEQVQNAAGFSIDRFKLNAQVSNLAIHIGTGSGSDNDPIWIGKYRHTQFGQIPDTRYHAAAAHCRRPNVGDSAFESAHKAVYLNGKIYTIDFDSEYVNRFDSNGEFEERSFFPGAALTAICEDRVTSGYILVYDSAENEIWRVNSNLEFISKMVPAGGEWSAPTGDRSVTDMEMSGTRVFLGIMDTLGYETDGAFVFSLEYDAQAVAVKTAVDLSFDILADNSNNFQSLDNPQSLYWYSLQYFFINESITRQESYANGTNIQQGGSWGLTVSPIFLVPLANGFMGVMAAPKYSGQYQYQYTGSPSNPSATVSDEYGFFITPDSENWAVNALFRVHTNKSHISDGNIRAANIQAIEPSDSIGTPEKVAYGTATNPFTSVQKITHEDTLYVVISRFVTGSPNETRAYRYLVSDFMHDGVSEMDVVWEESNPYYIEGNLHYRLVEHGQYLIVFSPPGSTPAVWRKIASGSGYVDDNSGEPVATNTPTMTATLGTGDGGFVDHEAMSRLYYRCSFIYDGIQESALSDRVVIDNITETDNEKPVEVQIKIPLSISRRVTHLNIYRAMSLVSNVEEGFYRLVESIPLNTTFTIDDGTWVIAYTDRKDLGRLGPTFESSAGLPEALRNTIPNYGLSVMLNDRLYVADCWHPDVDDARLFLFRSNRYAVNIFNWPEENIRLPETPTAMEEFSNRLFVFTQSSCIVINPESMYVERVFDGIGALGRNAVAKTPSGLYVAGRNHAYIFTGADRQVISDPIEAPMQVKYDFNWQAFAQGENHNVCYHEERNEILFSTTLTMANAALNGTLIFGYHLVDRRWRREYQVGDKWKQLVPTSHGEVAIATESGMKWPNASTLDVEEVRIDNFNKVNSVYSRDIDFGDMLNHKWIYAIKVRATDKNFELFMNDVPIEKGITTEPMFYFKIPDEHRKQRSVRLRIRPKGAEIGQVSIIYRPKVIHAGQDF